MNPQYMNQMPTMYSGGGQPNPQGYGAPPQNFGAPPPTGQPGQPTMLNGTSAGQMQPGPYNPQLKGGLPQGAVPNGPAPGGSAGPQGDSYNRFPSPNQPHMQPMGGPVRMAGQRSPFMSTDANRLPNQMNALNLSGQGALPNTQTIPPGGMPMNRPAFQPGQMGPGQAGFPRVPPVSMAAPPNSMGKPSNYMGGPPSSMAGPPNSMGGPPNSMGGPSSSMGGPPNLMGVPPNSMGVPPNSMGGPPTSMGGSPSVMSGSHNLMGGPPSSMGGPPSSMGGPPSSMGGPPNSMGGPPSSMGGPPSSMGGPPSSMGGPPSSMGSPPNLMGGMPSSMGGPPNLMGGPPNYMGGPPNFMTGPPNSMGGPPSSMGGLPNSMGAPSHTMMPGPPNSMSGQPMGGPPNSMAGPSMCGPPSSMTGPPMAGPLGSMSGPPNSMAGPPLAGPPGPMAPPSSMAGPPMGGPPGPMSGPPMYPPTGQEYMGGPPQLSPGGPQSSAQYGAPPHSGFAGQRTTGPLPGQQQQARRLDPDQVPSPIQVVEDDRRNRSGPFQACPRSGVPPLVTTQFQTEDQGNCNPRMMRSTMYTLPCTADMLKQSHVPFALNIAPFARLLPSEQVPPVVDLGRLGPVRCNRCKAYMCPYMQFIDGGRRFECNFCHCTTEVPAEYFAHLDHTGKRMDCYDRPELCLGAYEFVATEDYCKNNVLPKPPVFIFMLDVSYNSVKSGLVQLLCSRLKEDIFAFLPKGAGREESEIQVGFVTYAKELHFYNVKSNLAQPQMLVVSDVQDMFVPLLDGFLVKPSESETVIDSLLEQIPHMFADSRETETVLGPVIQAGLDALQSAGCVGKLIIFHTSLPIAEAPGKLRNRDDRSLVGTDKEKTVLTPQSNFYTKLAEQCVTAGCGVDLFLLPNSYIDVASVSEITRLTGGSLYKYSYFQADLDGERLISDLRNNLMKPMGFDCIMRIRTNTGIRATDFLGNFYMSNTTDVELAVMDCDKSVTVEIRHDDKLSEAEGALVQAALLYTSVAGERRLRVMNLALACSTQMADLFRNCELDTVINTMAKQAIRQTLNGTPRAVRETLTNACAQMLACYRKNCATPSSAGQLILPECMKLLPVYSNCLIKSGVLQGGADVTTDDRSFLMHTVNALPVVDSCCFFYPRLLPLHEMDVNSETLPAAIRCSYERLHDYGVYLIENGLIMLMWIGINASRDWIQSVFAVQSAAQIDIDMTRLHELDNPLSRRVRDVVQSVRDERRKHMKLTIVRQRDKLEPVFQQYLVEDRSANGSASYVDFLCHVHKEIRNLLT